MPKYFCEYCGIYLTHSSPGGRNQHSRGRKHINNKIEYYSQILYEFQQNISDNLAKMTSHILNKPKNQTEIKSIENNSNNNNAENKEQSEENVITENSKEIPIKKAIIHIPGQMPLSVPLQYVPNIPINEKIMKAIPNKLLQPQYKKFTTPQQEDISKKEIIDINEGENFENNKNNITNGKNKDKPYPSNNILENLKRMKYSYNDPNPDNNELLLSAFLKNEEEDEQNNKK